jgi:hypothetical protein
MTEAAQSPRSATIATARSARVRAIKPFVLVPLALAGVIAAAILPRLTGYAPYGQRAIEQQIDQEDSMLCGKFALPPGTGSHSECKAALADLRHRHELLLLY